MAPPHPKDSFPSGLPALPAVSIVRLMPDDVISLVDHLRKGTGD